MIKSNDLYSKQNRYVIQSWVCDYGIYDVDNQKFIGKSIESYSHAVEILIWLIDYFDIKE